MGSCPHHASGADVTGHAATTTDAVDVVEIVLSATLLREPLRRTPQTRDRHPRYGEPAARATRSTPSGRLAGPSDASVSLIPPVVANVKRFGSYSALVPRRSTSALARSSALHALVVSAPASLRERLRGLPVVARQYDGATLSPVAWDHVPDHQRRRHDGGSPGLSRQGFTSARALAVVGVVQPAGPQPLEQHVGAGDDYARAPTDGRVPPKAVPRRSCPRRRHP